MSILLECVWPSLACLVPSEARKGHRKPWNCSHACLRAALWALGIQPCHPDERSLLLTTGPSSDTFYCKSGNQPGHMTGYPPFCFQTDIWDFCLFEYSHFYEIEISRMFWFVVFQGEKKRQDRYKPRCPAKATAVLEDLRINWTEFHWLRRVGYCRSRVQITCDCLRSPWQSFITGCWQPFPLLAASWTRWNTVPYQTTGTAHQHQS